MFPRFNKTHEHARLNVSALVLVTVPLIAIVTLAIWALTTEQLASRARAIDAARYGATFVGKQVEAAFKLALQKQLTITSDLVADTRDPVGMLRRLGRTDPSSFSVLFENGMRTFPPQESTSILWAEQYTLAQIEDALNKATSLSNSADIGIATSARSKTPIFVACQKISRNQVLCITSPLDALRDTVRQNMTKAEPAIKQAFQLIDPQGATHWSTDTEEDTPTADTIDIDLTGALEGWRVRAHANIDTTNTYALLIAAIIGPVLAAWGVGLWSLVRSQSDAVRQHKERAEGAARLSHDLRTPIANLAIYVDLIARHGKDRSAITRCCKALEEEIDRLAIIAECTLRRSRGLPPQTMNDRDVEADQVIQGLITRYKPLMERSGCTITFDAGAPLAIIHNRTALERILVNLIDNARSHAGGANVRVATKKMADQIILTIDDDGCRTTSEPEYISNGHGLGLKVIEELTQSCGGAFRPLIESSGSQFEVALPIINTNHSEYKPNGHNTNSDPSR